MMVVTTTHFIIIFTCTSSCIHALTRGWMIFELNSRFLFIFCFVLECKTRTFFDWILVFSIDFSPFSVRGLIIFSNWAIQKIQGKCARRHQSVLYSITNSEILNSARFKFRIIRAQTHIEVEEHTRSLLCDHLLFMCNNAGALKLVGF